MKMKSRRSRSAARRSGSGRKRKATDSNNVRENSKSVSVSRAAAEPHVGAKAPVAPTYDEVTDDVEFPEAVVLIGKTHWRCVTCMVLLPRTSSIDEHLNTHHKCVDSPPTVSSVSKREEGRGIIDTRDESHAPKATELESKQKVLRSSLQSMEVAESGKTACEKETAISSIRVGQEERGKNVRGGSRRGRGGGGHGRGKVFTKPLTSEDSDTEVETLGSVSLVKVLPGKGEDEMSVLLAHDLEESTVAVQPQADTMTEGVSPPPNKKARGAENDVSCVTASMHEPSVENIPFSSEHVSRDTLKDLMKERYVVFVGKGGTIDYPIDSEGHIDNDPPLPIETPSLQADAFLPPATPFLPDIHGPPETPVPPETPHPSEVTQQTDPFHPSEASSVDCQESTQSELLSPVTPDSVAAAIASEHLSRTEEGARVEQPLTSGHHFSSDGLMPNKPSDRDFALASVCVTCGAAFDSPEELRQHREEMVKFDIVSCNRCGDKFHGLHQLNIHVFTTHEKFAKKFCFLCDVDCLDGFELQEHLLEHTSVETDGEEDANDLESVQHTCKTCGMEVEGNLSDLMNHYHTTHDQFVCAKCYELFTDLTEYEDHKMLHCSHADCAVVYSCPVSDCFQLCEDKEALMDHISWHEDRDIDEEHQSLLQCHYCSDHFRNPASLQRHLADTHNEPDLRPFVCELCREAFGHSLELHQHNAIRHGGVKRYGCAYCDQCFAFRSAHRRHVASEHDVAATVLRM